jgi:DNA polymerase-1
MILRIIPTLVSNFLPTQIMSEGPEEHAEEALAIVVDCMENPMEHQFEVKLTVDASIGNTWYEAK